jgi:hypothetical protein
MTLSPIIDPKFVGPGVVSDNTSKDRAVFYRERAAEARAKAEAMTDYAARRTMLEVAEMWELMARQAEQSARKP